MFERAISQLTESADLRNGTLSDGRRTVNFAELPDLFL